MKYTGMKSTSSC